MKVNMSSFDLNEETLEFTSMQQAIEGLSDAQRRVRQSASQYVLRQVRMNSEVVSEFLPEIVDALYRPETQTRKNMLEVLTVFIKNKILVQTEVDSSTLKLLSEACDPAEEALFDELSPQVRLTAFRFFVQLCLLNDRMLEECWGVIRDALSCSYGESTYYDMLKALIPLCKRTLPAHVQEHIIDIVSYDAQGVRGKESLLSAQIMSLLSNNE